MSAALLLAATLTAQLALRPAAVTLPAPEAMAPDTVVVCPEAFREALRPWLEYRRGQGHTVAVVASTGRPEDVRRRIWQFAPGGRLRFVVLVGDGPDQGNRTPLAPREVISRSERSTPESGGARSARLTLQENSPSVPVHYAKARVNVLWGSEPWIPTDNWYAQSAETDDGHPAPRLAVGRLTANTPEQLRQIVAKTIAYERSRDFGPWRHRLNLIAGVGGFGAITDAVIESAAQHLLTQTIPADYRVSMTYGSWQSAYCPPPCRFHSTALQRLNEGALFWVYLGHGQPLGLDAIETPEGQYPILSTADADAMACRTGQPIALLMACYTGAWDARADCLAETMLHAPGGPVAVVAGSRVTMPYAMSVLATSLTDQCFQRRCPTLGEAVLGAKQALLKPPAEGDSRRALLDTIAAAISPAPEKLEAERAEHVLLFNLLGDPLLRLRYPKEIRLSAPSKAAAGKTIEVSGTCPVEGRGVLELVVRRDRLVQPRPVRKQYPEQPEDLDKFQAVYDRANDRRLVALPFEARDGRLVVRLAIPPEGRGACHLCARVSGAEDFASGAVDISVAGR